MCGFSLNPPPPPPPSEHTHYMHMEKCWPRNAGIVYMMRNTWWCLALRNISGRVWCPWLYRRAFRLLLLERGWSRPSDIRSAHHCHCDGANDSVRSRSLRVSFAEAVDKLRLGHEGLPVGEVCNIMDFFVTQTTGKSCKATRSHPKMLIFLPNEQASTLPPLKRTSFVWNKMPVIGDGPFTFKHEKQTIQSDDQLQL